MTLYVVQSCHVVSFSILFYQVIFDAEPEDPNYNPLPEERPGGFEWGAGGENARANNNLADGEEDRRRQEENNH